MESGEGSRESAKFWTHTKNLNTHRTDTPHHTTPHHTTPHHNTTTTHPQHNGGSRTGLGQGGSLAGWSPKKTRHEQQNWPMFSRMIRIGLGTKRFDQKGGQEAVWAKSGVPKVVRAKRSAGQMWLEKQKNMEKTNQKKKYPSPLHPKHKK